jgi:hypothetical protein
MAATPQEAFANILVFGSDDERAEVTRAIEAELQRTREALTLPWLRELPDVRARADRTINSLSAVLERLTPH